MGKNRLAVALICIAIALCTVLSACNGSGNNGEGTAGTKKPARTTQRTEVTTAVTEPMVTVSNLVPFIKEEDTNQVLGRLDPPLTVNIDDYTTIDLVYLGWPTVCKGDGSTLYAAASARMRHVDPFGVVVMFESHDNGETWSEPQIVVDTPLDDRDAGILYLGNGRLLISWFTNEGNAYIVGAHSNWRDDSRITDRQENAYINKFNSLPADERQDGSYVILSDDYGKTWGEIIRVPVTAPHGPTLMQDGETLIYIGAVKNAAAAGFPFDGNKALYIITSKDGGRTWTAFDKVDREGGWPYSEPHIIQLKDGSFLAASRVEGYFDIYTYISRSLDGHNWTPIAPIHAGQKGAPPHLLQLSNGAVLLSYGYRAGNCGSRYRISYDGGVTWSEEMILEIAHNPDNADLGYPSTVELDDGSLFTIYYQYYDQDRVASVLYTRWWLTEFDERTP